MVCCLLLIVFGRVLCHVRFGVVRCCSLFVGNGRCELIVVVFDMLFVEFCRCLLFAMCYWLLLFVVHCLLFDVCCFGVCCVLFIACCLLCVVCLLIVVRWLVCVVRRCWFFIVYWLLCVACRWL